jgi:hypothetical protein
MRGVSWALTGGAPTVTLPVGKITRSAFPVVRVSATSDMLARSANHHGGRHNGRITMNYPAPVACTACGSDTIGTFLGGLCRRCNAEWRVTPNHHHGCEGCDATARNAIAHAKAIGSTQVTCADHGRGNHGATVTRITVKR